MSDSYVKPSDVEVNAVIRVEGITVKSADVSLVETRTGKKSRNNIKAAKTKDSEPSFEETLAAGTPAQQHAAAILAKANAQLAASQAAKQQVIPFIPPDAVFVDYTRNGLAQSYRNALAVLVALSDARYLKFSYDIFENVYLVEDAPTAPGGFTFLGPLSGELQDRTLRMLRQFVCEFYNFDPGFNNVCDAVIYLCERHPFHPLLDYFEGLVWDGTPRVNQWLSTYCAAEDTELTRAVGRTWMTAAVRRIYVPGYKYDNAPILESPEGFNKSSLIRTLAVKDKWFSDAPIIGGTKGREQQELTAGIFLYELAELAGMKKADVNGLKSFMSKQEERGRPAYGRVSKRQLRTCTFMGTINPELGDGYLRSQTGNRRFNPITVGRIDLEAVKRDLDQLWAEAVHLHKQDPTPAAVRIPESLWAVAAVEQSKRTEVVYDPWEGPLAGTVGTCRKDGSRAVHYKDIWRLLDVDLVAANTISTKRVSKIMVQLGWDKAKNGFTLSGVFDRGFTIPSSHPRVYRAAGDEIVARGKRSVTLLDRRMRALEDQFAVMEQVEIETGTTDDTEVDPFGGTTGASFLIGNVTVPIS